ncbi:MAG: DUF2849 domain-containing protein [Rhizobiaceae bacterium]
MARVFKPKVVTANDLLEGDVIYMKQDGEWSRRHNEAALFEDENSANDALAKAHKQADLLVGAYLADAQLGKDGKPEPVHFREEFRTRGPSNYPDHGKQAEL